MNDAVYYKVSYVVEGGRFPGTIINTKQEPKVGDKVEFNGRLFTIVEIMELMPPAGDFGFLHATCRYLRDV
jgi:formate hydrogenlyase subunit 4